jgi:hypothetical protein
VYGIGRRGTPTAFVNACDQFIYLELLGEAPQQDTPPPAPNLKKALSTAISSASKDDGWSHLGEVGNILLKNDPAFDARRYAHPKLSELVRAQSYVEVKDIAGPTGTSAVWVRLKPTTANRA